MTMRAHLTDETLMDLCEGTAAPEARAHLEACAECLSRVEEAQQGLVLARQAGEAEPSPLYWPALSRNVRSRIDGTAARGWSWWAPPLLAAASLAAVVAFLPDRAGPPPSPAASYAAHLPAWSALPPAEDDPGLPVLAEVAPLYADAVSSVSCQDVSRCLASLSDEEDGLLAEALRQEWGGDVL
jgi:hypothetical protein